MYLSVEALGFLRTGDIDSLSRLSILDLFNQTGLDRLSCFLTRPSSVRDWPIIDPVVLLRPCTGEIIARAKVPAGTHPSIIVALPVLAEAFERSKFVVSGHEASAGGAGRFTAEFYPTEPLCPKYNLCKLSTSDEDEFENELVGLEVKASKNTMRIEMSGAGVDYLAIFFKKHFAGKANQIDTSLVKAYSVKHWGRAWYLTPAHQLRLDFSFPDEAAAGLGSKEIMDDLQIFIDLFLACRISLPKFSESCAEALPETGYLLVTPLTYYPFEIVKNACASFLVNTAAKYKKFGVGSCDEFYPVDPASFKDRRGVTEVFSLFASREIKVMTAAADGVKHGCGGAVGAATDAAAAVMEKAAAGRARSGSFF